MGKIKVYELAKELNIQSKDIVSFLQVNGIEGKVAQSALEEDQANMVKKKFAASAPKTEAAETVAKAETEKQEAKEPAAKNEKAEEKETVAEGKRVKAEEKIPAAKAEAVREEEAPKKKKRIVIVGNPQNSKSGMNMPQDRPSRPAQDRTSRPAQDRNRVQDRTQERIQEKPHQEKVQENRPQPQKAPQKSEMSAEQMKAKFSAILGENKQSAPKPAEVKEPVKEVVAEKVERPVFKPEINAGNVRPVVVVSSAEAQREAQRKAEQQRQAAAERKAETQNSGERRNDNRGENRQGGYGERRNDGQGYGDRRNDNRGENRQGGYGERRNDGQGYGDRRNDNRGENRQGGYGERRNDGQGYGDRRNDNRGENRQGGYGERRNDGQGYGDRRNDNRGENRQGGYGERRNDGQGYGDRRNDNRGRQGGYDNRQGGFGGAMFDKDKDDDRPIRPGQGGAKKQGSQSRSNGGFGDVAPAKDNKRDERRTSGKEKERNKKEFIYEDEDQNVKGKNTNKAGKFIKPEKKAEVVEEQIKVIQLPDMITIKDLADKMKMQPSVIIKKLFMQGKIVTVNHELSYEEAEEIAMEYEILCEKEVMVDVIEELLKEEEEGEEVLVKRPPVICVMGHVDHGKTSLLDAIRKTHVTDKEAGGITQHIGAYTVTTQSGEKVTFLDTPGHEAFTAMRMRGANATDIAILVVAADDGVMPQTIEAINHAKAAGIEIIVAVNKIDKPAANIERVKQELTEYELVAEDWGGSTVFCPVSAKRGDGIEDLLDMILLTADVLELKANPKRQARGLVIEAQLDKGRGPVATVLVQKGTLHVGDFISAGACFGKVRAMIDDKGRRVKEAGPSTPVEILGLSDVPEAGEVFLSHDSDKTAKTYAETYMAEYKARMLEETKKRMSLDDLFGKIQEGNLKELNIIVKADVQGSVEAVKQSLAKLSNDEVVVKCIHGGVGLVNESDVVLASASNAIIIGFNSRPDATAKATAEREGVEIKLYRVIYQAIEDIEKAMKGMLDPIFEEKVLGHAEVRQIFKASAVGNIAGSYVLDGVFQRGCKVRISREGKQIFEGELASLKRFKDDVKEVRSGFECGLVFEGFDQMQEFDIVEAYTMVEVPR